MPPATNHFSSQRSRAVLLTPHCLEGAIDLKRDLITLTLFPTLLLPPIPPIPSSMAAKFLFCLPLRLGVFLFTILQFLICGAAAGFDWYLVYYILRYGEAQEGQKSTCKNASYSTCAIQN